jgi:secondary thiamine-phosphate synthase enzyme
MPIYHKREIISTEAHFGVANVTDLAQAFLKETIDKHGFRAGLLTVFTTGSACGLLVLEDERRLVDIDFRELMNRYIPYRDDSGRLVPYAHHDTFQDDNASSHLKAAMIGPTVVIPVYRSKLVLGPFQSILLVEFDTRDRQREVHFQLMGE